MMGFFKRRKRYNEIKNDIQKNGYEAEEKKQTDKLIGLFKEMLAYKNKSYDDNWNFEEWIDIIDTEYHYYRDLLDMALNIVQLGFYYKCYDEGACYYKGLELDDVQRIAFMQNLYKKLKDEDEGYKKFAYYYRGIELKDGQTYSDLYQLEKEKMLVLFKKMLDSANVKHYDDISEYMEAPEKEDDKYFCLDFDCYLNLVIEHCRCRYYKKILINLRDVTLDLGNSYIVCIDTMRKTYENIEKGYKSRKQDLGGRKKCI